MPAVTHFAPTGDAVLDGLLGGTKWAVSNLSFSFPASSSFYGSGYGANEPVVAFAALSSTQKAVVRSALGLYASVANVSFAEIAETSTQHADLRFALSDKPTTAWAYYPDIGPEGGDVWLNNSSGNYAAPTKGNYAYLTFIHEIGHALGLKHPHEVEGQFGAMPTANDSLEYTVMSYRSYVGASTTRGYMNGDGDYPQSPMMYDIVVLQHLYGANYSTYAGSTTYRWSPATGEMFVNGVGQGAPGSNRVFLTVWDGGGIDTYDFSAYTTDLTVDLHPGAWTITSTAQLARLHYDGSELAEGNIANALLHENDARSLIENAIGGSGSDTLRGNQANNDLHGGSGNDALFGYEGNDLLDGGSGNDTVAGGIGSDVFYFGSPNLGTDRILDFSFGDQFQISAAGFGLAGSGSLADVGVAFTTDRPINGTPTLIFDQNGHLSWDPDGTGSAPAIRFADLDKVPQTSEFSGAGPGWHVALTNDFDSNGNDDIFWFNKATGEAKISYMAGDQVIVTTAFATPGPTWSIVSDGDFNEDRALDLIWRDSASGASRETFVTNGQISSWVDFGVMGPEWKVISTGNFDNKGADDILWQNQITGEGLEWFCEGGFATGWRLFGTLGVEWKIVATLDLNHDSTEDLYWQNSRTGEGVEWFMTDGWATDWRRVGTMGVGWDVAAVADFDGDADADLLWQETSTGRLVEWYMTNEWATGWADLGTSPGKLPVAGLLDPHQATGPDVLLNDPNTGRTAELSYYMSISANDWLVV